MKFLVMVSLLTCATAFAKGQTHQVSFSSNYSAGWSGEAFSAQTKNDARVDTFEGLSGEITINYAYTLSKRLQVGFAFTNITDESTLEFNDGSEREYETANRSLFLFTIYNFHNEFNRAFYAGAGLATEIKESEIQGADNDYIATGISFLFGKRFPLTDWGIENLTYAPMITFTAGLISGDLEDDGVERVNTTTIDIVKFDLLF